jgi:putative membrane protein
MFKSLSMIAAASLMLSLNLTATPQDSAMPPATAPAKNTRPASAQVAPTADEFLKKVSQANRAEIELGRLAQARSSNAQVKTFGQMLIDDHTKSLADVTALAQTRKITMPLDTAGAQQATKMQLERASGTAFDRQFATVMVTNHTNAVRDFETAAKGTDAEVKAFATKTLPTLRHHLAESKKLAGAKNN